MKNNKIGVFIIAAVLIAAVGFVFLTRGNQSGSEQISQATVLEETVSMDQEEEAVVQPTEETDAVQATEEQPAAEEIVPTARVGLQATDPTTANLASGDLQLIEAFAFW